MKFPTINQISIVFGVITGPATIAKHSFRMLIDAPCLIASAFKRPSNQALDRAEITKGFVNLSNLSNIQVNLLDEEWKKDQQAFISEERYKLYKNRMIENINSIFIGIMRTIPVIGGILLSLYDSNETELSRQIPVLTADSKLEPEPKVLTNTDMKIEVNEQECLASAKKILEEITAKNLKKKEEEDAAWSAAEQKKRETDEIMAQLKMVRHEKPLQPQLKNFMTFKSEDKPLIIQARFKHSE